MVKIEKSNNRTLKETPSTRILYINSNSRIKRTQYVTNSLTLSSSDLIVKKLSKIEKKNTERRDLCIETDNCILRRHFKEKRNRRKRRKSKTRLGVERSSLLLVEVNSENGSKDARNGNDEEIETLVENLKMLLNKYIDKHMLEDDRVMAKIRSSFRAILNNVLSPSMFKLDEASKSGAHRSITLNKLVKDQSVCQCHSHLLNFSKGNMCRIPETKGTEKEMNTTLNSRALWCLDEEKMRIVTKTVKLKKCTDNKGHKTFLLCMDKSGCSLSSIESFEVLAAPRKSTENVKDLKKGSLMAIVANVSSYKLENVEKNKKQTHTAEDDEKLDKLNVVTKESVEIKTTEMGSSEELCCDRNKNGNERTIDVLDKTCASIPNPIEDRLDNSRQIEQLVEEKEKQQEEELILASNLQESSDVTIEETELNDKNEDVLSAVSKTPSEKFVKFLVTPIKEKTPEVNGTADSLVKSLYEKNAEEGNMMTNKGKTKAQIPESKKTKSYYQNFKKFGNIKKSKLKKTVATKRTKSNKRPRVNECHILRMENHDIRFGENSITKQFQTIADYLAEFAAKGNITLNVVIKIQAQNNKLRRKPNVEPEVEAQAVSTFANKTEDSTVDTLSEAVNVSDITQIVKTTKKNHDDGVNAAINKIEREQNIMIDLYSNKNKTISNSDSVGTEFNPVNRKKKSGHQHDNHAPLKLTQTVSSSKEDIIAVISNSTESNIAEVIQLLDAALSHDKYLQESDESIETIEAATCKNEVFAAIVNQTKAKIIAEVLDLLDKAVSRDKHLHNYYKSYPNVTARTSKYDIPVHETKKPKLSTATEQAKEPVDQILYDLKSKLIYLTAATKESYKAHKKDRSNTILRKVASINYPCLDVTTYGDSIVYLEDIGYFVARLSSASGFLSKDSNDSTNGYFFKEVSEQDKLVKEENAEIAQIHTSVPTQISTPFLKKKNPLHSPNFKKIGSYTVIDSESIIKVTDMTSESFYYNGAATCSRTKATACSLPSSRAVFELATVDDIEKSKAVSFVSKQINPKSLEAASLDDTVNADAYLRMSLPQPHDMMYSKDGGKKKLEDVSCSNNDTVEQEQKPPTFGTNQICYFLTAQHDRDQYESTSSIVIEMDSLITTPQSKLKFQTVRISKRQALICCLIIGIPFAVATGLYYVYLYAYNYVLEAKVDYISTSTSTTVSSTTTIVLNLKEYGL